MSSIKRLQRDRATSTVGL